MKYYYTGYSVMGWIPGNEREQGRWRRFATLEDYKEAYADALCPY